MNDTDADARRVVRMLANLNCKVNLIALNPGPGIPFETPDPERVASFQAIVRRAVPCFIRKPRGLDIYRRLRSTEEEHRVKIIVPHRKTKQEVIAIIDRGAKTVCGSRREFGNYFRLSEELAGIDNELLLQGRRRIHLGLPLSGTVEVDDHNVIVECELPAMIKNFLGDDKINRAVEGKVKLLLA